MTEHSYIHVGALIVSLSKILILCVLLMIHILVYQRTSWVIPRQVKIQAGLLDPPTQRTINTLEVLCIGEHYLYVQVLEIRKYG